MVGFFKRLFGAGDPPVGEREAIADRLAVDRLGWLLDAPLFIDEALVTRLFDAVVRPEYEVQSRVVGELNEEAHSRLTGGEVEGKYSIGLPFLTGKIDASAKLKHERERSAKTGHSTDVTEHRVNTPGRRLEELAAVYLNSHPGRIAFISSDGSARTFEGKPLGLDDLKTATGERPRMLVFLDLHAESKLMPMACELQTGETVRLYQAYIERLWPEPETRPAAPAPGVENPGEAWRLYWLTLAARFNSMTALEVVEEAGKSSSEGHGRIAWINFRMPFGPEGEALHLNIVADGKYHAGVFGYNFTRRGFSNGVRVVGTLRSGLALNVIAIFDT